MTSGNNYTVFRECLSSAIVARSEGKPKTLKRRQKGKRNGRKEVTYTDSATPDRADPEELAEFIDVHTPHPLTECDSGFEPFHCTAE